VGLAVLTYTYFFLTFSKLSRSDKCSNLKTSFMTVCVR
jgi:hypothetical protein